MDLVALFSQPNSYCRAINTSSCYRDLRPHGPLLSFFARETASTKNRNIGPDARSLVCLLLRGGRSYWNERSLTDAILDVPPADAPAPETEQPDQQRPCVPHRDERHLFPDAFLLHAPNSDEPS